MNTTAIPDANTPATEDKDNCIIAFNAPDITNLTVVKIADIEPVIRPTIIFSDELIPSFVLGETDICIELSHLFIMQQADIAVLAQAKREVLITSVDLEHERFDNDAFIEALSAFARSSRYTHTKILVAEPRLAIEDGHRLIKLIRRVSSLIEIRQFHENDVEDIKSNMIIDNISLLRCLNRDPWQGSLLPKGTPYVQQAQGNFYACWERAKIISDFRELKI